MVTKGKSPRARQNTMVDTKKYISYYGKKLEDLLSDLVKLEEYKEEKEAELEIVIDGVGGRILDMRWRAPLKLIPNRFIKPFLKDKIEVAYFMKCDDIGFSKITIHLEY